MFEGALDLYVAQDCSWNHNSLFTSQVLGLKVGTTKTRKMVTIHLQIAPIDKVAYA